MSDATSKTAYMFPGVSDLTQMSVPVHDALINCLESRVDDISSFLSTLTVACLKDKRYENLTSIDSQIVGYFTSCAVFDTLRQHRGDPDYLGGYSVGVFPALYASGAVSFVDGAALLHQLNELVTFSCSGKGKFGMATVVGLDKRSLDLAINGSRGVEVTNQNSETSFIISGTEKEIKALEDDVLEAGALFFKVLKIELPYHSTFLMDCQHEWRSIVEKYAIRKPQLPVISATTAEIMYEREACIAELENNFCSPFSWLRVLEKTWQLGVRNIYQCGASKDLQKIGRYSGFLHTYHKFTTLV